MAEGLRWSFSARGRRTIHLAQWVAIGEQLLRHTPFAHHGDRRWSPGPSRFVEDPASAQHGNRQCLEESRRDKPVYRITAACLGRSRRSTAVGWTVLGSNSRHTGSIRHLGRPGQPPLRRASLGDFCERLIACSHGDLRPAFLPCREAGPDEPNVVHCVMALDFVPPVTTFVSNPVPAYCAESHRLRSIKTGPHQQD